MSARYDLLAAISFNDAANAGSTPEQLVDAYRAEILREAADKLTLELSPEQPGAGMGFLHALRLATRALRRMSDEAATR